jgi:hypothetical protein
VPRVHLVLHAFPVDPALRGLVTAADDAQVAPALASVLPRSLSGLELSGLRTEVVKYVVGERAVLRYELWWRVQPSGRTVRQVVFGKVFADDRGAEVAATVTALQGALRDGPGVRKQPFLLPRVLGYLPESRLLLSEALPGSPRIPGLVRADVAHGRGPDADAATTALHGLARVAAALHRPTDGLVVQGTTVDGRQRTPAREIDRLLAGAEGLATLAPGLGGALASHLRALRPLAESSALPMALAHGDLTLSEVLVDGPIHSVFDLDSACVAEPALDLGHLTAHLGLTGRRAAEAAGHEGRRRVRGLERGLLADYAEARPDLDGEALARRTELYRIASLADLAVRSWLQLKPDRVALCLTLLDEAVRGSARGNAQTGQKDSHFADPRSQAIDRH